MGLFGHHSQQAPQQQYSGPPQPPPPWRAEWDGQAQRWYYVNQQNGQRTWDFPGQGGGYGQQSGGYGGGPSAPQQQQKQGKNWGGIGMGVAAGALGGAFLMHEGDKIGTYTCLIANRGGEE